MKRNSSTDTINDAATEPTAAEPLAPEPIRDDASRTSHPTPALTRAEAESRYAAARDAWTAAMRAANSGRPADLASLAIAQEAYELAVAERDAWANSDRIPVTIEREPGAGIAAAVSQELAWRHVREPQEEVGWLGRLRRRLSRR